MKCPTTTAAGQPPNDIGNLIKFKCFPPEGSNPVKPQGVEGRDGKTAIPLLPQLPERVCRCATHGTLSAACGECGGERGQPTSTAVRSTFAHSKRSALAGSRLAALCAGMNVAIAIMSSKTRGTATNTAAS